MSDPVRALTYVEIDVPSFTVTEPPTTETLRFAVDTDFLPSDIEAIPSLKQVSFTPATVSLGQDLGQRATVRSVHKDHKHVHASEAYDSGTYWGKFRGRYGLRLVGLPYRLIHGKVGQTLEEMTTRHFIIENSQGPDPQTGEFEIVAKDILKLASGDRAQAPQLSQGFLASAITAGATSGTLSPAGIGNSDYPASGRAAIGGNEIVTFTRSGDTLTLTSRGDDNTGAQAHSAQDRIQIVLDYTSQDPGVIIADLLTNYALVDASYIPTATWAIETQAFLGVLYSGTIPEPVAVDQLVAELIEQAGLANWWDEINRLIGLKVLSSIPPTAQTVGQDVYMAKSLTLEEQPDKRLSQVWVYFGLINPLGSIDDTDNYRSTAKAVDAQAEADFGSPAIKVIKSRWIPEGGRSVADQLAAIQLSRFVDPPRRIGFDLFRDSSVTLEKAQGALLAAWPIQDETGAAVTTPIQITRVRPESGKTAIEAEEMLFTEQPNLNKKTVVLDTDLDTINLRSQYDLIYLPPTVGQTVVFIINAGVIIGSTSSSLRALQVGTWPVGIVPILQIKGSIKAAGGTGGRGGQRGDLNGRPGLIGGTALFTDTAIKLDASSGEIFGGGGGGGGGGAFADSSENKVQGGAGGGGGAGIEGGALGAKGANEEPAVIITNADPGTSETGGDGGTAIPGNSGNGGDGGDIATAGSAGSNAVSGGGGDIAGSGGAGGLPGPAIDGVSFVTLGTWDGTTFTDGETMTEDIRGPEIN